MFNTKILLLCLIVYSASAENISFKNVTITGYSVFVQKFQKVIVSSNTLNQEIPEIVFDAIEIKEQNVPILYKDSITDIDDLDELIIEKSGLQDIQPEALKNLPRIRIIKLKDNQLKTIKSGVFNTLPVSDIDLSKNQISTIEDGAFDNMKNLLNVRLTDNKITKWNRNWFANTPLLTRVSFQHNLIEELPAEAFKNMAGVKKFGKVPLNINLIFSYNKIKTIDPAAFKGLDVINNLWLDNNLLEKLPEKLFNDVNSISNLKLNSNKMTCIEDKEALLKADMNDIDGNPFDCECLNNIKTWSKEKNKIITFFYSDMNCYSKRIESKMRDLEAYIKQLKINKLSEDDVEIVSQKPK